MTLDEWLTASIICRDPRALIRAGLRARVLQVLDKIDDYRMVMTFVQQDYWFAAGHRKIQNDELKKLRAILDGSACMLPISTFEDYSACEVATDMLLLGREDEAHKLLDEQAPRRHNSFCAECHAPPGRACREKVIDEDAKLRRQHTCMKSMSSMNCLACNRGVPYPHPKDPLAAFALEYWTDRVVPHWVRIHCEGAREMRGAR